jgi:hypothetical protein
MIIIKLKGNKNALTTSIRCNCYCDTASVGYAADCGEEAHGCGCQCPPSTSEVLAYTAMALP